MLAPFSVLLPHRLESRPQNIHQAQREEAHIPTAHILQHRVDGVQKWDLVIRRCQAHASGHELAHFLRLNGHVFELRRSARDGLHDVPMRLRLQAQQHGVEAAQVLRDPHRSAHAHPGQPRAASASSFGPPEQRLCLVRSAPPDDEQDL
eukprot:scaffold2388_cov237-Pinguiococcus_pyrenoidosus.AAC.2